MSLPRFDADATVVAPMAYPAEPFSMRPGLAASMSMLRFCRAGAAPPPSSAPSWPAMRNRRHHHAHGGRSRRGPDLPCRQRRRSPRARSAANFTTRLPEIGRPADARGARAARCRTARLRAAALERRHLCEEDREVGNPYRFHPDADEVRNHIHGLVALSRRLVRHRTSGKTNSRQGAACEAVEGRGKPGEVLDDRLTVACGEQAIRSSRFSAKAKSPMIAETFLRGTEILARGTALPRPNRTKFQIHGRAGTSSMPRYKLTIEYDGGPFAGWQTAGQWPERPGGDRRCARMRLPAAPDGSWRRPHRCRRACSGAGRPC